MCEARTGLSQSNFMFLANESPASSCVPIESSEIFNKTGIGDCARFLLLLFKFQFNAGTAKTLFQCTKLLKGKLSKVKTDISQG